MGGWLKGIGIDVWMEDGDRSKWTDGRGRDSQTGKVELSDGQKWQKKKFIRQKGGMNGRTERVTGAGVVSWRKEAQMDGLTEEGGTNGQSE